MRPRVIPVLLIDRDRRLVKTVRFSKRTYIGDPLNVIRILNEKEVDEIIILDIDATVDRRAPDLGFLAEMASECFVPLAYGGGLSSVQQCEELCGKGIEKVVFRSRACDHAFIESVAASLGSQAVVGCINYYGQGEQAEVLNEVGGSNLNSCVRDTAQRMVTAGCGEIIIQSIDLDGSRGGFDLDTIASVAHALPVPLVALGGAGDFEHFEPALRAGASAVASGSAFCFIGKLRAVLISYPHVNDIRRIRQNLRSGGP